MGSLGSRARRATIAAAGFAAVVAAGAFIAPAVFAAHTASTTMHFREPSTNSTFVDVGTKGTSQGDYLAWNDPIKDVATGKFAGHVGGVCTLIDVKSQLFDCGPVTYSLSGGTIYIEGLFSGTGKPETDPITGGTGKYQDARGTVTVTLVSSTITDHVLKLEG